MDVSEPEPLGLKNTYCPLEPTETQAKFLEMRHAREVFFGGAAGGGKSVALLMGALEYVECPGYAALIIRKDFSRLELAGGLIPRSHEWFGHSEHAKWIASRRQWIFPICKEPHRPPATIMFGYLNRPLDKFRYASSEFQYIAFDELTDFSEEDYLFLFSRLRRNTSVQVPLRMRSASNPGGVGHAWVKERFIPEGTGDVGQGQRDEFARATVSGRKWSHCVTSLSDLASLSAPVHCSPSPSPPQVFYKHGRAYIPSRIADNPHLDGEEYRQSLLHLPAVERERLMNGDWTVQERGVFHADWLRYYIEAHGQLELIGPDGRAVAIVPEDACYRFATIDPAGTSEDRTREARGQTRSWSIIQVWDQPPRELAKFLVLRHQVRKQVGYEGLCNLIREVHATWQPERIWIEDEKLGRAAWDSLRGTLPIDCVPTRCKDKSTRAGPLILKMEAGEIFLPQLNTTWRPKLEAELLAWTGDKRQVADQIDAAAYAAIVAGEAPHKPIRVILGAGRS